MDTQQRTYPDGVPSWIDLEQPDLGATRDFYGGLLGWRFEVVGAGQYVIATLDGRDVAGLAEPEGGGAGEGAGDGWNTYVAVDDADATAARVTAAGGRVVVPPRDAGPAGRMAVCEDPAGARFRLWQAGRRLGAQAVNEPGGWVFSNLRGVDAATVTPFYADVFGWETSDLGFTHLVRRPGYGDHLAATTDPGIHERQSSDFVPEGFADAVGWIDRPEPGVPSHWHTSIGIADRDRAVADVERLGGTVLATEESQWTRQALVRDPQGAELTLSQFTPPEG